MRVVSAVGRAGTMGTRSAEAIFTDLSLEIVALVRSDPSIDASQPIQLSVLGGRVGDRAFQVSHQVVLDPGDEALVFINPAAAPHPFVGDRAGVLRVTGGRVYSYDGQPLVAVSAEGFVFAAKPAPNLSPALEPEGTAKAFRMGGVQGPALTSTQVMATLKALSKPSLQ